MKKAYRDPMFAEPKYILTRSSSLIPYGAVFPQKTSVPNQLGRMIYKARNELTRKKQLGKNDLEIHDQQFSVAWEHFNRCSQNKLS